MLHVFLGGVAIACLMAALTATAIGMAPVPLAVSKRDAAASNKDAYTAQFTFGLLGLLGGLLAGAIAIYAWYASPDGRYSLRHFRTFEGGKHRHKPWYVAAFGLFCTAAALWASSIMPAGVEGMKPVADQVWSRVTTSEATLFTCTAVFFFLAMIVLGVAGGFHAYPRRDRLMQRQTPPLTSSAYSSAYNNSAGLNM